uniref:Uncharacterized protein n=1 Tax=Meloidogyne hapla TaxID=6305 RepID=A0A1I8BVK4_MELHA
MANPMQLIRKKRYYSGGYKSFADYNMVDKVVFFIVYIIGGGFILVLGSNVALLRILAFFGDDGDIHCPVPVIHLSEINFPEMQLPEMRLPEMRLPEFLSRRNQNPPPQQPQHPITGEIITDPHELAELGHQQLPPQPSNPIRYSESAFPHRVTGRVTIDLATRETIPDPFRLLALQNQHYRRRRNINKDNKECHLNGKTNNGNSCPNISFSISFHKDDKQNSIFSLKKNGCFDHFKNFNEGKLRKKRDVFEVEWKECGGFIMFIWFILSIIGWIVGAVFLGIYFWH